MTYRAIWPINDDSRTRSALIAEASGSLDAMALRDGAKIVGAPVWTVTGDRLVCEAPAVRVEPSAVEDPDAMVVRLGGLGWSVNQIVKTTGVHTRRVNDLLLADGIGEGT